MDSTEETPGPDLATGIPVADLADGAMINGRLGDDTVVLVRRGDEFFALDAHCTHYNGPLKDGLVVGDTIRCPWHHACFSLRTGAAERAPAMRPLRAFQCRVEGQTVRVLRDEVAAAPRPTVAAKVGHVAIVGAGAAGSFAANELRRKGFDGRITLLTREGQLPFDKPNLSKDYLAGKAPKEWIPLRSEEEYSAAGIELLRGVVVERVDPAASELSLSDGKKIAFDRLLLATGASPRPLDVPVAPGAQIHYLRTWADADALVGLAANARRAVVIGSSFIALEAAASLRERGLEVTIVGRDERPLERVLGAAMGDFVRREHEAHGVRFRLGRQPVQIGDGHVVLDDDTREAADLIVAGVGVEPDLALAEQAGLSVDHGIVVDQHLRTSAANIYAAGDAARFPYGRSGRSIRVEHWVAAARQGQAAARNILGADEPFTDVPFFWSQHYELVFAYIGHAEKVTDVQLFGSLEEKNAACIYLEGDRVAAVSTLYRDDVSLAVEAAMQRNADDQELLELVGKAFL